MMKHLVYMLVGAIVSYPGFYIGKWIVENLNVWQWMAIAGVLYGLGSYIQDWYLNRKFKATLDARIENNIDPGGQRIY